MTCQSNSQRQLNVRETEPLGAAFFKYWAYEAGASLLPGRKGAAGCGCVRPVCCVGTLSRIQSRVEVAALCLSSRVQTSPSGWDQFLVPKNRQIRTF